MNKISADLIREIENRAGSKELQKIAISLLEQISENSSDEYLRRIVKQQVDNMVREEEK